MLTNEEILEMADRIAYRVIRAGHTEVSVAELRTLARAVTMRHPCCAPATYVGGVTCTLPDGHDGPHEFPAVGR